MCEITDLWKKIINEGEVKTDRTGVGTLSVFGGQLTFNLLEKFPLMTIKKTLWKSAFIEMLWFLRGDTNIKFLKDHNVPIWDAWADVNGSLGPVYGAQWRRWEYVDGTYIDQVADVIKRIKSNPNDRRLIVSAWNVSELPNMALPPCHYNHQLYVSQSKYLDMMVNIRSLDTGLGTPFNVAQYALLLHLYSRSTGLTARFLKVNYGDAHLYLNHVDKIKEILDTKTDVDCKPTLVINTDNTDIDGYTIDDFNIIGYESNEFVKLPIAV